MHLLAEFGSQPEPLSVLSARYSPYAASGEINSVVDDVPAATARIREAFAAEAEFDELDGLTVTGTATEGDSFWWFNVRPSNTEPLLRLNAEADSEQTLEVIRDRALAIIRA